MRALTLLLTMMSLAACVRSQPPRESIDKPDSVSVRAPASVDPEKEAEAEGPTPTSQTHESAETPPRKKTQVKPRPPIKEPPIELDAREIQKSESTNSAGAERAEPTRSMSEAVELNNKIIGDDAATDVAEMDKSYAPDNTGRNQAYRRENTLTPFDQSSTKSDLAITRTLRRGLMARRELSLNAKNVKIITRSGMVTLRGPVDSGGEKDFIAKLASKTPGVDAVDNQLTVIGH